MPLPISAVVDTTSSPHARLKPVPVAAVRFTDDFWAPRLRINREVTLPSQHRLLEETGRLDNLRRAAGNRPDLEFQGVYFNDSDVYKWLEAAAWALASGPDPVLTNLVDETIAVIAAAQRPDGYLNSYFALERADERWTNLDLHELYCAGHLFQAAVAHYRATGSTTLLEVAIRFADHIAATFGPAAAGKRESSDGHEEVEMALVELYRTTGNRRYLDQAHFFVDVRGHGKLGHPYGRRFGPDYHQDHQPLRDMDSLVGHAVRAVYFVCGGTDLVAETGEAALYTALTRLWDHTQTHKTYVTGGLGARYEGEAFGADYELPNARAYTETCAAIASVMWNHRLLMLDGDARYADALETALYNAVLPGISRDGATYFYQNPLEDDGGHRRKAWFGVACCPPNVARLLASLPGYVYSVADDTIYAHHYVESTAKIALADGRTVTLRQQTKYPWDGEIAIQIEGNGDFALNLRIPAWCDANATIAINGHPANIATVPGSYAEIRRDWTAGDIVNLSLSMPVRRLASHPAVTDNLGRVALQRGPLIYCAEAVDNPDVDPRQAVLTPDAIAAAFQKDVLGDVITLNAAATISRGDPAWDGALYRALVPVESTAVPVPVTLTLIPYFAWANREPGAMAVWLRDGS